ncbi:condensation domain-containing protein, partial [Nostoc sp. CCY 9925]|uniref:condensation domain-containing protein n=1 Tax=Nostoc sp. CCY 9925 TaxID=3103865 RepID=UPI0039C63B86
MKDFFARLAQLSPKKRALLERLLLEKPINASEFETIHQRPEKISVPLSFAQERLWFLNQLSPNSSTYNIAVAVSLSGLLNVTALEQSLNEILHRHEALRTTLVIVNSLLAQLISPSLTLILPIVDIENFSEVEREAETMRLASEEAQ